MACLQCWPAMNAIPLKECEAKLKTGDMLLMNGGRALSDVIKCFTCSRFSHAGIIVRFPDGLWVMHSTPNPEALVARGETEIREGPILTRLDLELQSGVYFDVACRPLVKELSQAKKEAILSFYEANKHKLYEQNWIEVSNAAWDCGACTTDRADTSDMFCSEFVAATYQAIGLLGAPPPEMWKQQEYGPNQPANEYTPADLSESGVPWIQPNFGTTINIRPPSKTKVSKFQAFFNCSTGMSHNQATFSNQDSCNIIWMLTFCAFFGVLNIIGCVLFLTTFPFHQVVSVVSVMFGLFLFFWVMMMILWLLFVAGGAGDRILLAHYRVMQMLRRPLPSKKYAVESNASERVPMNSSVPRSDAPDAAGIEMTATAAAKSAVPIDPKTGVPIDDLPSLRWSIRQVFCTRQFAFAFGWAAINAGLFFWMCWYAFYGNDYAGVGGSRLGAIDQYGARVLLRNPESTRAVVEWKVADTSVTTWSSTLPLVIPEITDYTLSYQIKNLQPNTAYEYRISFDVIPEDTTLYTGTFTTQVAAFTGKDFKFAYTSCFLYGWPYTDGTVDGWNNVAQFSPDLLLFVGDLIYSDQPWYRGDDQANFERLYRQTYSTESFLKLTSSIPSYYMYDDHELKDNWDLENATPYYNAMAAWWNYAGASNPVVYSGTDVYYYNFTHDDTPMFILDTRRWRHPASDAQKTMLGDVQNARLRQWLLDTQAEDNALGLRRFKFISSTIPFTTIDSPISELRDTWTVFGTERDELFDFIVAHNITNVQLMSAGDHQTYIVKVAKVPGMYEFQNSPLQAFENTYADTLDGNDQMIFQAHGATSYTAIFTLTGHGTIASPRKLSYSCYEGASTTPLYTLPTLTAV